MMGGDPKKMNFNPYHGRVTRHKKQTLLSEKKTFHARHLSLISYIKYE